jgi:hypothetical protein
MKFLAKETDWRANFLAGAWFQLQLTPVVRTLLSLEHIAGMTSASQCSGAESSALLLL